MLVCGAWPRFLKTSEALVFFRRTRTGLDGLGACQHAGIDLHQPPDAVLQVLLIMETTLAPTLTFRVSAAEAEVIRAAASAEDRTLSNFVRRAALGAEVRAPSRSCRRSPSPRRTA